MAAVSAASSAHSVFGLQLRSHFPLPELPGVADEGRVDLELFLASGGIVDAAFSGAADPPLVRDTRLRDGCRYRTERGRDGDYRIDYGERSTFHLTAGGGELHCAPADPEEPSWRRFLLDSCLGTAALVHGYEALHAGAFELPEGVVAVVAAEGGGKSTLVAELVRRGHTLFCDDVLSLSRDHGSAGVVANAGPPLMNLPATLPDGTPAAQLGRVLAVLEDECWLAVERAAAGTRPVAAVVFLEREGRERVAVGRLAPSAAPVLRHSLASGTEPGRLARRFALFADLATTVPLVRLRVPDSLPATTTADVLEHALGEALAEGLPTVG